MSYDLTIVATRAPTDERGPLCSVMDLSSSSSTSTDLVADLEKRGIWKSGCAHLSPAGAKALFDAWRRDAEYDDDHPFRRSGGYYLYDEVMDRIEKGCSIIITDD